MGCKDKVGDSQRLTAKNSLNYPVLKGKVANPVITDYNCKTG